MKVETKVECHLILNKEEVDMLAYIVEDHSLDAAAKFREYALELYEALPVIDT